MAYFFFASHFRNDVNQNTPYQISWTDILFFCCDFGYRTLLPHQNKIHSGNFERTHVCFQITRRNLNTQRLRMVCGTGKKKEFKLVCLAVLNTCPSAANGLYVGRLINIYTHWYTLTLSLFWQCLLFENNNRYFFNKKKMGEFFPLLLCFSFGEPFGK